MLHSIRGTPGLSTFDNPRTELFYKCSKNSFFEHAFNFLVSFTISGIIFTHFTVILSYKFEDKLSCTIFCKKRVTKTILLTLRTCISRIDAIQNTYLILAINSLHSLLIATALKLKGFLA